MDTVDASSPGCASTQREEDRPFTASDSDDSWSDVRAGEEKSALEQAIGDWQTMNRSVSRPWAARRDLGPLPDGGPDSRGRVTGDAGGRGG